MLLLASYYCHGKKINYDKPHTFSHLNVTESKAFNNIAIAMYFYLL